MVRYVRCFCTFSITFRGTIKVEDIFYYLKHKEQFVKSLKRKDYNDAIEEIEKEIKKDGSDGDGLEDSVSIDFLQFFVSCFVTNGTLARL